MRAILPIGALSILIGSFSSGCQHENYGEAPATVVPPAQPITRADVYNLAALDSFPLQVRAAFRQNFPESSVTQAQLQTPESGPILYKIVYIQNGQPQSVTYDRAGQILAPPAAPRIETRPGFPAIPPPEANTPASVAQ